VTDAREAHEPNATRVERVTLFEDRAEVVRTGTTRLARGSQWIAFAGVTPFVDDRSVQARIAQPGSGVRVLGARVSRRVGHEQTIGHGEVSRLEKASRSAARGVQEAEIAADRARRRGDHARAVLAQWTAGLARVPPGLAGPRLAPWRAAYDEVIAAELRAVEAARESRAAGVRAEDAWTAAQARLREGQATHVRHEALLEVNIHAEAAVEAAIVELTYRTPGALWRPEHAARVTGTGPGARLEILTWATVWQRTGESWDDVELRLSTARPAEHATPPLVTDDFVSSRRKTDEERRTTVVEGREQAIETAGVEIDRPMAARVVEQMPGVDDGGAPLVYKAKSRAHLPGGGRPARIEIASVTLEARVDVVIYPELAPVAHLRARATLDSAGPLLAGPVHVTHDGNAAGRSRTRFVGAGEPFELGVGTEDALRVRRDVEAEDDTTAIVGTQRKKRTVTVWLTNLSNTAKRAKVIERVPVSELEGVETTFLGPKEWSFDDKDGFAEREVEVSPHATQKLVLTFEVRAASKMLLPQI
jgi:uncharacterized protein (TIGR02231 family)